MNSAELALFTEGLKLLDDALSHFMGDGVNPNHPILESFAKSIHGILTLGEQVIPLLEAAK